MNGDKLVAYAHTLLLAYLKSEIWLELPLNYWNECHVVVAAE